MKRITRNKRNKKIIICCDGTWNKPETYENGVEIKTNVQKIYEGLPENQANQVKYYGSGVGTGVTFKDNFTGGAFGAGIDSNIRNAYKFLMWNYKPGDQIYLFGFSRGAYTVRSLAGMMRNCGILKPENLHLVNEAYELYRERTPLTHPDSDHMISFKKTYAIEVETPVYFMGVWDTVGALGIPIRWFQPYNKRYLFHDVKLSSSIKYAYHALAIDEKRKVFAPTLWELSDDSEAKGQTCEQVWFSGVHSNVGGGYADDILSNIALRWMAEKAEKTGVTFTTQFYEYIKPKSGTDGINPLGSIINSRTGLFRFGRPFSRSINLGYAMVKNKKTGEIIQTNIKTNESLHYSCIQRCHDTFKIKPRYLPENFVKAIRSKTPLYTIQDWEPFKDNLEEIITRPKQYNVHQLMRWSNYLPKFNFLKMKQKTAVNQIIK